MRRSGQNRVLPIEPDARAVTMAADPERYFEFSPTDRAMAAVAERASFAPQLALELDAPLDVRRLRRAVSLLGLRHPILGATLRERGARLRWIPGTTAPAVVDVVDDASSALAVPFDLERGSLCRVVNVRVPEQPMLALGAHHALADGRALVVLLDDLRRIYVALRSTDGPVVDVDWSPRSIGAGLDLRGVAADTRVRLAWEAAERWRRAGQSTHVDPAVGSGQSTVPEPLDVTMRLGAPIVAVLDGVARARGRRVSHVLLALVARAWDDVLGRAPEPPSSVSGWLVTVDTRRQLGLAGGIGNLSGFEPVALTDVGAVDLTHTLETVGRAFEPLARFGAGMVAELVAVPTFVLPGGAIDRATRDAFALQAAASRYTRCYTNVGRLADELGDWGEARALGARWLPGGTVTRPMVAFALVTFGGATTISVLASSTTLSESTARAVLARVRAGVDELPAVAASR